MAFFQKVHTNAICDDFMSLLRQKNIMELKKYTDPQKYYLLETLTNNNHYLCRLMNIICDDGDESVETLRIMYEYLDFHYDEHNSLYNVLIPMLEYKGFSNNVRCLKDMKCIVTDA